MGLCPGVHLWETEAHPVYKLCFLLSVQKVAYKSKRWIYDLRTIAEVEGSGVKAWKHAEWKEQILVPALPQSILQGCSLIHIDYYIQVSLSGVSLGWAVALCSVIQTSGEPSHCHV